MLFLCEASLQNPFLHMSMLILLEIHIKDYIGHYFHMKSSYIIEYLSSNRMLNLVDYYSFLRLVNLETKITNHFIWYDILDCL